MFYFSQTFIPKSSNEYDDLQCSFVLNAQPRGSYEQFKLYFNKIYNFLQLPGILFSRENLEILLLKL